MGSEFGREESRAQTPAQAYLANLELAARAADSGQISFNRAVLLFPLAIKNDIFITEARSGRLDVYGFLGYAKSMPGAMSGAERKRAAELLSRANGRIVERLSQGADEALTRRLEGMAGSSQRFAALEATAQLGQLNSVIEIARGLESGNDQQRMDKFRIFLNGGSAMGTAGAEWSRTVLDIIYDRNGSVRAEIDRRADGNRYIGMALSGVVGFSQAERSEITAWLGGSGSLGSATYNKLNDLITGNVRGEAREILTRLGLDFPLQANAAAHDPTIQNIYDTNAQLSLLGRSLGGR